MTGDDAGTAARPEPLRRFVPLALLKPALAAALGIDGGPLFQILAVEDLSLSAAAIGTAFGLGLLSLPVQVWAARLPLHRARRNLQLFLVVAAIQALILAGLISVGATGGLAATALVITVTAEISISVLFTTAWQPLLSTRTRSVDRQRLNAFWSAMGRGLLAGVLVIFAAVNVAGRAVVLIALAAAAVAIAVQLRRVVAGDPPPVPATPTAPRPVPEKAPLAPAMIWILASFTLINFASLPMWLVYLAEVSWPDANLALVGAVQTAAVVAALLAWRSTDGPVGRRVIAGTLVLLAGSAALLTVGGTVAGLREQVTVFAVSAAIAAGSTYASIALLEAAHRLVSAENSVRSFTLLDVVDSSSLQFGLFAGGLLVTVSTVGQPISPYVIFVVGTSLAAAVVIGITVRLHPGSAAS
ncbi:hypothetical protein [Microlunatus sp. GCM10028923]|uniref:hypothetical protein n=1 Tax=Microlunatus sp. GCM10028923 TaxID=3273400 RepID=UPI00361D0A84